MSKTTDELYKLAKNLGVESSSLEILVFDSMPGIAENINSGGLENQLIHLEKHYGYPYVVAMLGDIALE